MGSTYASFFAESSTSTGGVAFFAAGLTKSIGDGYGSFYRGGIEIGIGRNGFFILAFDTP